MGARVVDKSAIHRSTLTLSFSGIDGAGKSTQIESLRASLKERGLQVRVIAFWDEIARLTRFREAAGHALFQGDKGVGTPERPIYRRDKNVRWWPMAAVRLVLYFIDAVSARTVVSHALGSGVDVVILDRWIHDELANLALDRRLNRAYARIIARLVLKPDISFVLDADPLKARARKPEYPIEFLVANRASYLRLSTMIDGVTVIAAGPASEVEKLIAEKALEIERLKKGEASLQVSL